MIARSRVTRIDTVRTVVVRRCGCNTDRLAGRSWRLTISGPWLVEARTKEPNCVLDDEKTPKRLIVQARFRFSFAVDPKHKRERQLAAGGRRIRTLGPLATSPSLSYAQIDITARHYEGHALEHRHVVEWARIHSDHICRFSWRDRSNFVGKVEQLGGVDRRCFDRFAGTHP